MGTTPKNKAIDAEYLLNQLKNLDKDILETKYVQEKDVKDTYTATDENPISGKGVAVAVNTLQQDINKKSNIGHKHTKSEITDFPTSMTPTAHNQASNTINAMTDYSKATSVSAITPTDTLNVAIGKLEKALDSKGTSSFSGSYNDLTDKPTIPSVGNGTITVNQNGTKVGEFSTNQSTNTAINLTNTTYDVATSSKLGLIKSGTDITVDSSGNVSVNDDSHNHVISNVDGLQSALDGKAASSHTHDDRYYTESEINTKLNSKLNTSLKGSASGLAELDSNGKVPSAQLPSFVDDVIEGYLYNGKFYKESAHTTVITGESGKIYIDLATNKTYRWSGSTFVVVSDTLALGETSTTAYRGDRGKTAYDHSQSAHARTDATKVEASTTNGNIKINGTETNVYTHPSGTNPHGTTKSDVGLGHVGDFKAVSTVANQGLTATEKSNARANIGAGTSSFSGSYNDLSNKPTIPSVGNGTVTIKQAGTSKGTFTMNQSGNTTIELTDNNTTYGVATSSALGLVKSGTDITVDSSGNVSVNDDSHNHVISNVDGLQSALDTKKPSEPTTFSLQPTYVAVRTAKRTASQYYEFWDDVGWANIHAGSITSHGKFIGNLSGNADSASSVPWSGITGKPSTFTPASHTHSYAGSSSAGGSATSAVKLDSSAGSATQPVYFSGGKPVACSYTLGKSVPSDAVFTDTNTWRGIQNNLTSDSTTDSLSAAQGKVLNEYKMDRSAKQGLGYFNTINLSSSSYDVNTYYPVTLSNAGRGFNHIVVDVQLDSGTKPSWSTHDGGFSCYMDILAISAGWGTITPLTICLGYTSSFTYNNENPCGYSQLTNSSTHVIWLRGGGKYYLYTDFNTVPTVRTSEYTVSSESVKPGATKPFSFTYSTIYANVTNSNYATSAGSVAWGNVSDKPSTFTPASHTHNYAGSSSAGGSATSAVSVVDYNDSSHKIKIGFAGEGATTSNLAFIAGYLSGGNQIKDVSKDTLKSWLGLGSAAYTNSDAYAASSHTHDSIYLKYTTVNVSQSSTVEIWRSNEPNSRKRLVLFTAKTYNNYHHNIVWFYNGKLYAPDFSSSVGNNTTLNNFTCTNTTVNYNNTETSTYPSAVAIVRCYDFMG